MDLKRLKNISFISLMTVSAIAAGRGEAFAEPPWGYGLEFAGEACARDTCLWGYEVSGACWDDISFCAELCSSQVYLVTYECRSMAPPHNEMWVGTCECNS